MKRRWILKADSRTKEANPSASPPPKRKMPGWSCCVPYCTNYFGKAPEHISWHSFPTNETIRSQWIARVGRDVGEMFTIKKNTKVCSAHFTPDDFRQRFHAKRKLLKPNAVPSVFSWTQPSQVLTTSSDSMRKRNTRKILSVEQSHTTKDIDTEGKQTEQGLVVPVWPVHRVLASQCEMEPEESETEFILGI